MSKNDYGVATVAKLIKAVVAPATYINAFHVFEIPGTDEKYAVIVSVSVFKDDLTAIGSVDLYDVSEDESIDRGDMMKIFGEEVLMKYENDYADIFPEMSETLLSKYLSFVTAKTQDNE